MVGTLETAGKRVELFGLPGTRVWLSGAGNASANGHLVDGVDGPDGKTQEDDIRPDLERNGGIVYDLPLVEDGMLAPQKYFHEADTDCAGKDEADATTEQSDDRTETRSLNGAADEPASVERSVSEFIETGV